MEDEDLIKIKSNSYDTIGRVAYGILHDITADINALSLNIGMLGMRYGNSLEEVKMSLKSLNRIELLLGLANGQISMYEKLTKQNINSVVKNLLDIYLYIFSKEHIGLSLNIESIDLIFSKIHFERILLNLINNSIDAIRKKSFGGSDRGKIDILVSLENGEYLVMNISDNGVGIPSNKVKNVFEDGYSTRQVTDLQISEEISHRDKFGTGTGLRIVEEIVCNYFDGSIEIDSTLGVGTKFIIKLPINSEKLYTPGA